MSEYASVNLFVGAYKVPEDGHIRLEGAKIRYLRGRVENAGWVQDPLGDEWLIVEDKSGHFWPVMINSESVEEE